MMSRAIRFHVSAALFGLALTLPVKPAVAQEHNATITGRVTDSAGTALVGVGVRLFHTSLRTRTDSAGRFRFDRLAAGRYTVAARRVGYHSASERVMVQAGETHDITIKLARLAVPLDTVVTEAQATSENLRINGFTRRQRLGFGTFLTRDDIARLNAFDVWDILRRTPFLMVTDRLGGHVLTLQGTGCRPFVYLDGMPIVNPPLEGIPADWVDGIEVYRHATEVPAEFAGARTPCGTVLIWTR